MEEGEGEDGDDWRAPDVQEFVYRRALILRWARQEASAFTTRLGYQEGQEMF